MFSAELRQILSLATELATRAAAVHADGRRWLLRVDEKGSPFNLVTEVDREAERVIVDGIVAARPGDAILGEEGSAREGQTGVRWDYSLDDAAFLACRRAIRRPGQMLRCRPVGSPIPAHRRERTCSRTSDA